MIITIINFIMFTFIVYLTMRPSNLKFSRIKEVKLPEYGTPGSAGIDFFSPETVHIEPFSNVMIGTGIRVNIPKGMCLIAHNKGGVAVKKQLYVGADLVDHDFQGEIFINLFNPTPNANRILKDEKIAQFVLQDYNKAILIETDETKLYKITTQRGEGSLGSTGS